MEGAMQGHRSKLRCLDGVDAAAPVGELAMRRGQSELQLCCPEIVVRKSRREDDENEQSDNRCR
jgi:hypothetical protein